MTTTAGKRAHDEQSAATAAVTSETTPPQKKKKKAGRSPTSSTKKKKKRRRKGIPSSATKTKAQLKTPTSVASGVNFLPEDQLEQFSEDAKKKLADKKCVGNELKERNARKMVEDLSASTQVQVRNGIWPWLSDVSIDDDDNIVFHRNKMNHNATSPPLSNEITNNFLGNPIGTDLKGKVHKSNMGADMTCFLTYNNKVCVLTMHAIFHS